MSARKKRTRERFRTSVFERDGHKCRVCGLDHKTLMFPDLAAPLDAHHITDRTLMPNGGYVKENGISLCEPCHIKAENFHSTGVSIPGFEPETLYALIGSSYELAVEKSKKLGH